MIIKYITEYTGNRKTSTLAIERRARATTEKFGICAEFHSAKIATRFSPRQGEMHLLLACRTIQFLRD